MSAASSQRHLAFDLFHWSYTWNIRLHNAEVQLYHDSESSGSIRLYHAYTRTKIEQSVFSLDSDINFMKWIYTAESGSRLLLKIRSWFHQCLSWMMREYYWTMKRVLSISIHRQFKNQPHITLCSLKSDVFSILNSIDHWYFFFERLFFWSHSLPRHVSNVFSFVWSDWMLIIVIEF
mgnify:CR=1 FL=1